MDSNWITWFFDGIGTELVSLVIGLIIGGVSGYKIGVKKNKSTQKQTARDDAEQKQTFKMDSAEMTGSIVDSTKIHQYQRAGNNAVQSQEIRSGRKADTEGGK